MRWTRVLIVVVLVVMILGAGAAAVSWWLFTTGGTAPLEPGWPARVSVLAGDGVRAVRDGDAGQARFADPFGIAVAPDGTIYVTDTDRIRRISPDGRVNTVAGGDSGFVDGLAHAARFSTPSGLALDHRGTLYIADTGNDAIRRMTADGFVSTIAGAGQFNGPTGLAVDAAGRVIVADTYNDRVCAIDAAGVVHNMAPLTRFHTPTGVAVDSTGTVYVADSGNGLIQLIDQSGRSTTPDWAYAAGFSRPIGVAVGATGEVYVTDESSEVYEIAAGGSSRLLAGLTPGFADGFGSDARFRSPAGVALAGPARLIVADAGNGLIRLVAAAARQELRRPSSPRVVPRFDEQAFELQPLLWPVAPFEGPHEIAGTLGEARGGDAERFHAGIDVRADEGTLVHAIRDGVVTSVIGNGAFDTLNESLRIGPISYVHIRAGRTRDQQLLDPERFVATYEDGKLSALRVKRGARFAAGEPIGSVNAFHHVHLNVGWPGEEKNPLRFRLVHFRDTIAPTIARGGLRLYDELAQPLTRRVRGRIVVSGRARIVVEAWDQSNGNRPSRRLGVYELGYQVLNRDGSPAPGFEEVRRTLRFDGVAPDGQAPRLVYAPGSGIPFYRGGRTRFLYVVTNTLRDGVATEGFWDTRELPPGDYIVRAWAADIEGNIATAHRDVPVTVTN